MREQELYNFLKENFYPDLTFSNDKMSQWDCYSPSHFHRIELKCRGSHYEELLIEKKKYNNLHKRCSSNIDSPIYINSTPKGIYRFDLFDFNPEWQIQSHNKTTEFEDNKKIEKEVGFLQIRNAEVLYKF
jgi:hypothetical protein